MVTVEKGENAQNDDVIDQYSQSKLLSFCIAAKDDDYMLDFRYRITTTINHLARSIKNLGQQDQVEILVTDWGSHVPMAQTLELSPEAAEVCRFIYVSPKVICDTQEGKDFFHTSRALNVALRRANGKFIIVYAADTLIQEHSLAQLFRLLKRQIQLPVNVERSYFMVPRFQVPWQFLERRPDLEEWDRYLLLFAKSKPLESGSNFSFFGSAGALMMHRFMWSESRGFDESQTGWGWIDNDLGLRVSENHLWLSLTALGVILYHMGHTPHTGRRRSALSKGRNPFRFNAVLQVNDKDWGIGSYELEIQAPQIGGSSELLACESGQHEPASIESWPQSCKEIVSELENGQLTKNVKLMVMSCLCRDLCWVLHREEINALFFLSWYSHNHYPRRYLEFSCESSGAVAVVAACPSVEIYKVGHWEGIGPNDSPDETLDVLDAFEFCGHVRFVNGAVGTAIQRLKDSFVGHFGFDLMLVGGKMVDKVADDQVCRLISYLSPGGALILRYSSTNDFVRLWQKIRKNYSQYTYFQCADQKTGMVLATKLRDYNYDQASQVGDVTLDTRWFTLVMIKTECFRLLIKLYRKFVRIPRKTNLAAEFFKKIDRFYNGIS